MIGCIYCGSIDQPTKDHVPPAGAFPKPRPQDLITVPACLPCNKSFEKDDEYLKSHLALRGDIEGAARADELLAEARRGWSRPEAARFAAFIKSTFREQVRQEADGNISTTILGHEPDNARLNRVLSRTIRGLYYYENDAPLPREYSVRALPFEVLVESGLVTLSWGLDGGELRTLANGAFEYLWKRSLDDPNATMWLLVFYGSAMFYGITAPPRESQRPAV